MENTVIDKYQQLNEQLSFSEDTDDLGYALKNQAPLYHQVCEEVANAYSDVSAQKLRLEIIEAETKLNTRRQFDADGIKATEGKIQEVVDTNQDLITEKQTLIAMEDIHIKWQNLKRAFESKQETLKIFSQLIISGYLSY